MKIKDFLKEMVPVVVGILIALFINNWNEERNNKAYIDKMLIALNKELEENKSELSSRILEHQQLLDTIAFYEDKEVSIVEFIGKCNGLRNASIKNTAWKAIMNSRIDLLDYEIISLLTSIDENKEDMKTQFEKLIDLIYNRAESTKSIDVQLFELTINDLLHSEMNLLELHEAFTKTQKE